MEYILLHIRSETTELDFYIEVDDAYMEIRKIELADGGILGFANSEISCRGTVLAATPLLPVEELALAPNVDVKIIDKQVFDAMWSQVVEVISKAN